MRGSSHAERLLCSLRRVSISEFALGRDKGELRSYQAIIETLRSDQQGFSELINKVWTESAGTVVVRCSRGRDASVRSGP